jgi:hypothetical protein
MTAQISFVDQRIPSDKTEPTAQDIFRSAGQIMFNYYKIVLKKDIRRIKINYSVTSAK